MGVPISVVKQLEKMVDLLICMVFIIFTYGRIDTETRYCCHAMLRVALKRSLMSYRVMNGDNESPERFSHLFCLHSLLSWNPEIVASCEKKILNR